MREREGEKVKPPSNNKLEKTHQNHQFIKEEKSLRTRVSCFFYLTFIAIIAIFSLHLIFDDKSINFSIDVHNLNLNQTNPFIPPRKEIETCDFSEGKWIQNPNFTMYAESCPDIPPIKNCLMRGRKDRDYLNWKWKPNQCEISRFDAVVFLSILRGKKMAFVGDSLARNQAESLVCLLSTVETPESIFENIYEVDRTWKFPEYNFTLVVFWSPFLVAATKIPDVNGYHLDLDRANPKWSDELPSIDYIVFSGSHWFYRENRLHENGKIIGCVNCHHTNHKIVDAGRAIRPAFRTAFRAVNGCGRKIVAFVRTYSPGHFERSGGSTRGNCPRTWPIKDEKVNRANNGWRYRKIQLEEMKIARAEGTGKGNEFDVLDVTEMMATRADGHPDRFWHMTNDSDCLHWCLPGPVDMWNWFLFEKIKRLDDSISSDTTENERRC